MPEGAIYVGRPSRWGNPFTGNDAGQAFRLYIAKRRHPHAGWVDLLDYPSDDEIQQALAGLDLACWCPPTRLCHADTLLAVANSDPPLWTDRPRQSAVPGDTEPEPSSSQRSSTETPTTEEPT